MQSRKLLGKKIRIAFLFHKYSPENEGISISLKRLAYNLPRKYEIHIISGSQKKGELDLLEGNIKTVRENGIFVHYFPFERDFESKQYGWGLDNFLNAIKVLHAKYSFNILHSYYIIPSGFIGTLASKLLGIPCIVSVRGGDVGANAFEPTKFSLTEWTLKNCNYLVFVNEYLRDLANSISPIKDKSRVIKNSISISDLGSVKPTAHSNKKHTWVLGFVGDIKRRKGLIYLLEALNKLKSENIELYILGSYSDMEKEIYKSFIKDKSLGKMIKFHKPLPHSRIGEFYNKIDILVIPSIDEGSPNTLLEGMYFGKPIVGTNIKAISQTVSNIFEAILVEPRNADALRKGILVVINNKEFTKKLIEAAKSKVLYAFKTKDEIQQFICIYNLVLQDKSYSNHN